MTNNTTINVSRELLEELRDAANEGMNATTRQHQIDHFAGLIAKADALLSDPSPAGVDGLETIGYATESELAQLLDPTMPTGKYVRIGLDHPTCWKEDAPYEHLVALCVLSDAQAIIDGLRGEVGAQRVKTCTALKDRNDARKERDAALAECERLRMQLAACGVVALANTIESAGEARQMHPDYMSASCSDVADAVDREIALRAERDDLRQQLAEARDEISQHSNDLALAYMKGGADMRQQRDKLADILRDLVPGCKWRFMRPRIDAALAEIDHGNE